MQKLFVAVLVGCLWLSAGAGYAEAPFKFSLAYYMKQVKETTRLIKEADDQIFATMERLGDVIDSFYFKYGRFREAGPEEERLRAFVAKICPNNPFKPKKFEPTTGEPWPEQGANAVPLKIVVDAALTDDTIIKAIQAPPANWADEPGTITIITNASDTYLIWAASADRLPLRSPADGRTTRMIYGHFR